MRIIRLKIQGQTSDYLKLLTRKFKTQDASFIEDLYSIVKLKGNGLPDDARAEKIAAHYAKVQKTSKVITKTLVNKRRQVLKSLTGTAIFRAYAKGLTKDNPVEFTERLLLSFRKLHRKLRQAQCLSCHLLSQCEFGKTYGDRVRNINIVIDPDYSKKVNQDCPNYPEIELVNEISKSAAFANNMAQQHQATALKSAAANTKMSDPFAKSEEELTPEEIEEMQRAEEEALEESLALQLDDVDEDKEYDDDADEDFNFSQQNPKGSRANEEYSTSHEGGQGVILDGSTIDKIKMATLLIYELSQKLELLLERKSRQKQKTTEELTKDRTTAKIRSASDVPKIIPSQHALPDNVFEKKLARKELVKIQQQQPEKLKKQLLYVLLDTSESMTASAGLSPVFGFITRGGLAASFSIALSKRTRDDKGILFLRCFEGNVDKLWSCRTIDQFEKLEEFISECQFNGYSTNIPRAIDAAIADIKAAKDELSKAEILCVTDAADHIADEVQERLRKDLGDIPLNILDVAGSGAYSGACKALQELSDNYLKVSQDKGTLEDMVNLVGGKKKSKKSYT